MSDNGKLYRSTRPRIIRAMTEDDVGSINYNIQGAFDPADIPLAYVWKDPFTLSGWTYMSEEEFAEWKLLEI